MELALALIAIGFMALVGLACWLSRRSTGHVTLSQPANSWIPWEERTK